MPSDKTQFMNAPYGSDVYDAMFTDLQGFFHEQFRLTDASAVYKRLTSTLKVEGKEVLLPAMQLLGGMKEWNDMRQIESLWARSIRVKIYDYEHTLGFHKNDLADDKLGLSRFAVGEQGVLAGNEYDEQLAALFNSSISGAATTRFPAIFDGQDFFSSSHAWDVGYTSSQSNLLSGSGAGVLSATNYKIARKRMRQFKRPDGKIINRKPDSLIVATDLYHDAVELFQSAKWVSGESTRHGEKNPIAGDGIEVIEFPQLTDGYWVLADLSGPIKPWWLLDRQGVTTDTLLEGYEKFMKGNLFAGVDMRFNVNGQAWWRAIAGDGT